MTACALPQRKRAPRWVAEARMAVTAPRVSIQAALGLRRELRELVGLLGRAVWKSGALARGVVDGV